MHSTAIVATFVFFLIAAAQCKSSLKFAEEETVTSSVCDTDTWFHCKDSNHYLPPHKVCDYSYDCSLGDDESTEACL